MSDFFKVFNAVLPTLGIFVSAFISWAVARTKAKNEIEKLSMSFSREEQEASNKAFSDLLSNTARFCEALNGANQNDAHIAVCNFVPFAPLEMRDSLNSLDKAIHEKDSEQVKTIRDLLFKCYKPVPLPREKNRAK